MDRIVRVLRREGRGLLFVSPWLLGFLAFGLYPTLISLYYSFTRYTGFGSPVFTGWTNLNLVFHDPVFWIAVKNTLFIVGLGVPLSLVFGLLIALPLNARIRGQAIYRTLIYLPTIVPSVVMALAWLWIYN